MRHLGTAVVLTLLAACGSQTPKTVPDTDGCAGRGAVVAKADLDGAGSAHAVRLTGPGTGPCADRLLARGGVSVDVSGLDLVAARAKVVHLAGDAPDLVLLSAKPHPRGGAQWHLFGAGGKSGLTELTEGGQPLVPFVATDGGAAPMTVTCTNDGGVGIVTAQAHEPPGVVLAWDVTLTSYSVESGRAVLQGRSSVAKAAADPTLHQEHPELYDGSLFADCS
ncbi:MAG: hypothetical protein ABIQ59_15565 [Nocardioidaceae bacterium]